MNRKGDQHPGHRSRPAAPKPRVRTLAAGGGPIEYRITERLRVRRRLHLELDEDGQLLVVVPPGSDTVTVQRALRDNLEAVESYVARARARRLPPLSYADGARHLYRGQSYRLQLVAAGAGGTDAPRNGRIRLALAARRHNAPGAIRHALRDWYRDRARSLFAPRLEQIRRRAPWSSQLLLEVALRRMRRTWGTCRLLDGGRAVIRLNTHLVKAPTSCLDFVIGHELCHLAEMNHGPGFYRLQEAVCPDWRTLRDELRERGHYYTQE